MRSTATNGREELMEEARLARQQRQRDRALTKSVLVVQSVWRGRRAGRKFWNTHRNAFDKRVADLDKVAEVLAARTPPHDFVVPPKVLFPLLRQFCAFAARSRRGGPAAETDSTTRLPALCALIAKSVAQPSAETNIMARLAAAPVYGVAISLARLCLRSVFRPVADLAGTKQRPIFDVLLALTRFGGAGAGAGAGAGGGFPHSVASNGAKLTALRAAVAALHRRICSALLAPPCAIVEELRRATLRVKPVWQSKEGRCVEAAPLEWALTLVEQQDALPHGGPVGGGTRGARRAFARRVLAIPALAARLCVNSTRLLGALPRLGWCVAACAAAPGAAEVDDGSSKFARFWQAHALTVALRRAEYSVLRDAARDADSSDAAIAFVAFLSAALATLPPAGSIVRAVPRDVREAIADDVRDPVLTRTLVGALFPPMSHAETVEALFGGVGSALAYDDDGGGGGGGGDGDGDGARGVSSHRAPRSFGDLVRSSPWARRLLGLERTSHGGGSGGRSSGTRGGAAPATKTGSARLPDTSGTARALASGRAAAAAAPRSRWSLGAIGRSLGLVSASAPPAAPSAPSRALAAATVEAAAAAAYRPTVDLPALERVRATVRLLSTLVAYGGSEDHSLLNVLSFSTALAPWLWACFARDLPRVAAIEGGWLSAFGVGRAACSPSSLAEHCGGDGAIALWCVFIYRYILNEFC